MLEPGVFDGLGNQDHGGDDSTHMVPIVHEDRGSFAFSLLCWWSSLQRRLTSLDSLAATSLRLSSTCSLSFSSTPLMIEFRIVVQDTTSIGMPICVVDKARLQRVALRNIGEQAHLSHDLEVAYERLESVCNLRIPRPRYSRLLACSSF